VDLTISRITQSGECYFCITCSGYVVTLLLMMNEGEVFPIPN
jgi:putative component of membrane protein insertase Oxa1/YidC/SpoIIIJ protein YidD